MNYYSSIKQQIFIWNDLKNASNELNIHRKEARVQRKEPRNFYHLLMIKILIKILI